MTKKKSLLEKKRTRRLVAQFSEYMAGGALYFWAGYGVFAIAYSGLHLNWFWAKVCGDVVGRSLNYVVQRYWTFRKDTGKQEAQHMERYVIISVVSVVIDYSIVGGLKWLGITPYIGQLVSSAFFTVWNWLWYRLWVFPKQRRAVRR